MRESVVVTGPDAPSGSSVRVVVERPAPGLARGRYEWPGWAVGALGGVIVAAGIAFIVWRFWRLRRG